MIYLASGFFCERELETITWLESTLDVIREPYFSPRQGDANDLPMEEKMKPENAQRIFEMDCAHMDKCNGMIAYLGGVQYFNPEKRKVSWAMDSGVLFEMGYMAAQGKPIIGFTDHDQPVNLMLARSLMGYYDDPDQLQAYMLMYGEEKANWGAGIMAWLVNSSKREMESSE